MIRLLKIEFYKLRHSKTFWIIFGLYAFLIIATPFSIAGFLQWVKAQGGEIDNLDPTKIPLLHFPDVWQNLTFIYGFIRIFLGILVIISVSNEYSYRTVRQNVIDGLSRKEYVASKLIMFFTLSVVTGLLVFITILLGGVFSTPDIESGDIANGLQFVGAFVLSMFTYMCLALLLTTLIQRTGLSIAIILTLIIIEVIITQLALPESLLDLSVYFPMQALENLIKQPFTRYAFQEIQDYVSLKAVGVVFAYCVLFIYLTALKLKKSDL